MAQEVISDFLIKFGFDAKNVENGLKKINKLLDQYEKRLRKMPVSFGGVGSATPKQPSTQSSGMQDAHVKRMQQQIALQERLNEKTEAYLQSIRARKSIEAGLITPDGIRKELNSAKTAAEYQTIRTRLTSDLSIKQSNLNKELKGQNYLLQRANQSSKQLVGNYVSAFAAVGVLSNVITIGQDMEGVRAQMLAASESSAEAKENFKWIKDFAYEAGLDLKSSASNFAKIVASAPSAEAAKKVFRGVGMYATVNQLTTEQSDRVFSALQQMFGKQQVMAEELKGQMAEHGMPKVIEAMAIAAQRAGIIAKDVKGDDLISKLAEVQQKGLLKTSKVMEHFSEVLVDFSNKNNAYVNALKTNRTAMNRLKLTYAEASDLFFQSGFGDGLTELFNDLAANLRGLNPLISSFGRIFGSVMRGLSTVITLASAPFKVFGMLLDRITQLTGKFSAVVVPAVNLVSAALLYKLVPALQASTAWMARVLVPIAPFIAALGLLLVAFDELEAVLNPNRLGVLEEFGAYLGGKLFDVVQDAKAKLTELGIWIRQWANDLLAPILEPFERLKNFIPSMPSLPSAPTAMNSNLATKALSTTAQAAPITININGVTDPKMVAMEVDARMRMYNN